MTAFLPVPQDDDSETPDAVVESARTEAASIVPLPPKPRAPRKPKAKKPRPSAQSAAIADPGPPPPLPPDLAGAPQSAADDLVIPPKPPLPPVAPVSNEAVIDAPAEDAGNDVEEAIADDAPAVEEIPAEEVPDDVTLAEGILVEDVPFEDVPADEVPADEIPVKVIPAEEVPADETAVQEIVEEEASLDEIAAELAPWAPASGAAALTLRGISKSFGSTRAVDDIELTIPAGTFYGLVGPNGAGKTTTLSMIAGLLRPDRGAIDVAGVDAIKRPVDAKRLMGVLPDRLRTFDRLTGRQLLHYYGVLRGLSPKVVESRSADLARAFDLTDSLGRVVSDYSAGMVKKIMLAGAMIHSPRVLVLDEPFESVDPVSSATILDILSAYVAHGGTVILSSHGMELVERVCTRVAVLVAGHVLAEGSVDEVRGELTLEQRFIELAGGTGDVEGLEWLHTFSD